MEEILDEEDFFSFLSTSLANLDARDLSVDFDATCIAHSPCDCDEIEVKGLVMSWQVANTCLNHLKINCRERCFPAFVKRLIIFALVFSCFRNLEIKSFISFLNSTV